MADGGGKTRLGLRAAGVALAAEFGILDARGKRAGGGAAAAAPGAGARCRGGRSGGSSGLSSQRAGDALGRPAGVRLRARRLEVLQGRAGAVIRSLRLSAGAVAIVALCWFSPAAASRLVVFEDAGAGIPAGWEFEGQQPFDHAPTWRPFVPHYLYPGSPGVSRVQRTSGVVWRVSLFVAGAETWTRRRRIGAAAWILEAVPFCTFPVDLRQQGAGCPGWRAVCQPTAPGPCDQIGGPTPGRCAGGISCHRSDDCP